MFFGFGNSNKKKKVQENPDAREKDITVPINFVVQLAVLAIIGYALVKYISGDDINSFNPVPNPAQQQNTSAKKTDNCFCLPQPQNHFFGSVLPVAEPHMSYEILNAGDGPNTVCGQEVQVKVEPVEGNHFPGETDKPLSFRTGAGSVLRGLELGVMDMSVGSRYRLHIPPAYAHMRDDKTRHQENKPLLMEAELLSAHPEPPQSTMPMRVFMLNIGQGGQVKCGDRVAVQMDLWSAEGELLFSTRLGDNPAGSLTLTLGMAQLPFALEQALLRMRPGSEWSFILPSSLMTRFNPPQDEKIAQTYPVLLGDVALPDSGIVIADIVLIEVLGRNSLAETTSLIPRLLFGGKTGEAPKSPPASANANAPAKTNIKTNKDENKKEPVNEPAR